MADIRAVHIDDCDQLLDLIHEHAKFERSIATIGRKTLLHLVQSAEAPVHIVVAAQADQLVAYAAATIDYSLWRGCHWAHLDCLFVSPEHRSSGLGAKLLHHVRRWAIANGADRLEWQTPEWNERAIGFYRREGGQSLIKQRFWIALR